MDGLSFSQAVKQLSTPPPIVLMTPLNAVKSMQGTGFFASVIGKPLKQVLLRQKIHALFTTNTGSNPATKSDRTFSEGVSHNADLKILLVEDNVVNRKLAIRMMHKMGYEPEVATNGLEGVEAVKSGEFQIVLMDVQMPVLDGLSATRRIRTEISPERQPIIIAMTANAMQGDREKCIEAGMNDYISKPFRMAELAAKLSEYGSTKKGLVD
ncbi:MAG: response regulator [Bacteroidota bacterium]